MSKKPGGKLQATTAVIAAAHVSATEPDVHAAFHLAEMQASKSILSGTTWSASSATVE
jgi:hypothetical protein